MDLPAGFSVDKSSKYRAQNVLVVVQVPVGKKINIENTVFSKLSNVNIEFNNGRRRVRSSRYVTNNIRRYRSNTDYTMQSDGSLKSDDDTDVVKSSSKEGDDNYRWDGNGGSADSMKVVPPVAPPPPPPPGADTAEVYHYNQSPSQNKSKEEMARELEQKQKEIEALKKKLAE